MPIIVPGFCGSDYFRFGAIAVITDATVNDTNVPFQAPGAIDLRVRYRELGGLSRNDFTLPDVCLLIHLPHR